MIDVQDVRLYLLAIANATDCPMWEDAAHQLVSAERRGARSADMSGLVRLAHVARMPRSMC
jgi:hypothetical protein